MEVFSDLIGANMLRTSHHKYDFSSARMNRASIAAAVLTIAPILAQEPPNTVGQSFINVTTPQREAVRIRYVRIGNASESPLVFLHGSPGSLEDLHGVLAEPLSRLKRDAIFLDVPGYGQSTRPVRINEAGFPPQDIAGTIYNALTALGAKRSTIIAHSHGGVFALATALSHPEAVSGLVLLAPVVMPHPGFETSPPFIEALARIRPASASSAALADGISFDTANSASTKAFISTPLGLIEAEFDLLTVFEKLTLKAGDQIISKDEITTFLLGKTGTQLTPEKRAVLSARLAGLISKAIETGINNAFSPGQVDPAYLARELALLRDSWRMRSMSQDGRAILSGLLAEQAKLYPNITTPIVVRTFSADKVVDAKAHAGKLVNLVSGPTELKVIQGVGHMEPTRDPRIALEALTALEALLKAPPTSRRSRSITQPIAEPLVGHRPIQEREWELFFPKLEGGTPKRSEFKKWEDVTQYITGVITPRIEALSALGDQQSSKAMLEAYPSEEVRKRLADPKLKSLEVGRLYHARMLLTITQFRLLKDTEEARAKQPQITLAAAQFMLNLVALHRNLAPINKLQWNEETDKVDTSLDPSPSALSLSAFQEEALAQFTLSQFYVMTGSPKENALHSARSAVKKALGILDFISDAQSRLPVNERREVNFTPSRLQFLENAAAELDQKLQKK